MGEKAEAYFAIDAIAKHARQLMADYEGELWSDQPQVDGT
jgi:hypothetical protein